MPDAAHNLAAASWARYQRLAVLLQNAQVRAGSAFSGLGVLVTDNVAALPLFPIGPELKLPKSRRLADVLGSISRVEHPCHDGFHVLDSNLELVATSQYFSPPLQAGAQVDRSIKFGGRYLAALFGSCLTDVHAAGIATQDLGVLIFAAGRHVEF